ncbi:MAG: hypothetical protein KDM91_21445 [Verrucomicrobiae bacterium]|nr:hypothetical protein [Verrucomicrobiae bacterium]MCP5541428.1 hypothetical protein [Akkermansiaceae bacterium]
MSFFPESWSDAWWAWMGRSALEGTIALLFVLPIWFVPRRRLSARVGHALCMLVLLKVLVPMPVSIEWWRPARFPGVPFAFEDTGARSISSEDTPNSASNGEMPNSKGAAFDFGRIAFQIWLVTAGVGAGWLAVRLAGTVRLLRRASPVADSRLAEAMDRLIASDSKSKRVLVLESPRVASPSAWGLFGARIVVPPGFAEKLTPAQIRWALAHELTHLRRGDGWWLLFESLVGAAFFWHPAVWIARRMAARLREEDCDRRAAFLADIPPREAASGLLAIAETALARRVSRSLSAMPAMAHSKPAIHLRIMKIKAIDPNAPLASTLERRVLAAVLLVAAALVPSFRPDWTLAAENERIAELEKRVAELEGEKDREARLAELRQKNKTRAGERARQDLDTYTRDELREIEQLYQVANKEWRTDAAKESLAQLLKKYDKANRTGCATLYMGQMSEGEDRGKYLTEAVEKFSDCFYLDGCQVGGYARYILGIEAWTAGKKDEANRLFDEIRKDYAEAIMHNGTPVVEALESFLSKSAEG